METGDRKIPAMPFVVLPLIIYCTYLELIVMLRQRNAIQCVFWCGSHLGLYTTTRVSDVNSIATFPILVFG